jgi:hypothetical protein
MSNKRMDNMKEILQILLGVMVASSMMGSVYGWGVTYSGRNIEVKEGDSYDIRLGLQNMIGNDEITVTAELQGDTEIAEISQSEIVLPPKTRSLPIYIRVNIPANAKDTYTVTAVMKEKGSGGEMVNLQVEKSMKFTINVIHAATNSQQSGGGSKSTAPTNKNNNIVNDNGSSIEQGYTVTEQNTVGLQNQTPIVPDITQERNNVNVTVQNSNDNGFPIIWVAIVAIIIIAIICMWWSGWI